MRALALRRMADGRREKVPVTDWPPPPAPTGNQVKARALFTGVTNGTERNGLLCGNYAPQDKDLPNPYGYQHVGRVVEVGPDVKDLAVGDVIFSSSPHLEFVVVPEDGLLTRLPDGVEPAHAALFGVAGVAMHDVRRAETKIGDNVLVVGAGPIGQFTAQAARAAGAVVTVADLDAGRLAVAAECGAHRTVRVTGEETWAGPVKDAGPYDIVFEDSGADVLGHILGRTWGQCLLKHFGKCVLIAGRFEVNYSFNAGQGTEITVLHAGHFGRDDLQQVARLVAEGTIRVAPLLRDVVGCEAAKDIYDRLRDDPQGLLGTVFDWGQR